MVSSSDLALILSAIAVVLAAVAVVMVVDIRARTQAYESTRRGWLERQTPEGIPGSSAGDGSGIAKSFISGDKSISSGFFPIPETPPTAIAPGLKTPPRPKGGFGSRAKDASQLPPDDQASRREQDGGDSSTESGAG